MTGPLDAPADVVPAVGGGGESTLVDGRTFAIGDRAGNMSMATHGMVHDDRRHVSTLRLDVVGASTELLASASPTPIAAVMVSRLISPIDGAPSSCLLVRRRWLAGGMRDDIEIRETGHRARVVDLELAVAADFAHVFDVKAGRHGDPASIEPFAGGWHLCPVNPDVWSTRVHWDRTPDELDVTTGVVRWRVEVEPREIVRLHVLFEPVVLDDPVDISLLQGGRITAIPLAQVAGWRDRSPTIVSRDPRLAPAVDQAMADLAALRIVDREHPDRVITAAGAPWYMTLFGRDSLITALMTLPFDRELGAGVLGALADLQGRVDDPMSEEEPGKILHELRRHGSGGPFAERSRYYGTVDATPLFVVLAAEARRWGSLDDSLLGALAPAIGDAVTWLLGAAARNSDGWVEYSRSHGSGLSNQGWKDSWDGVTFADGTVAKSPIALVEVQGYAYAALLGAAELGEVVDLGHDPRELRRRAESMRSRFNETFWDERGWFLLGLDGHGGRIDALTTNPGHALWSGIADATLADRYVDQLLDSTMWSGWGLRTLATSMGAYDPLSYHNGSVWPHDTMLCAAGAARYGRWDLVDRVADGMLDVAGHFGGRPPELFAGIDRDDVPTPVAYPAACSPQAWSSASILLLVRSMLGIEPTTDGPGVVVTRGASTRPDVEVRGLFTPTGRATVRLEAGEATTVATTP